jgi:ABC-type phosphate/phosphonate transport system substrate-binding protein
MNEAALKESVMSLTRMIARHVSALSLLMVLGCQQNAAQKMQVVQIGTTKVDLLGMPPEYRALHPRLEDAFGEAVRFSAQPNGSAIGQQLANGDMKFAIVSAQEYADISDPANLNLIATGVNEMGKTSHKALIVARASDQRFKSLADCSGKRFAFGNYKDILTDYATRQALETGGVPLKKLLPELLPPPFAMEGRLYVQNDVAMKISVDLTVNAGVIDERVFNKMQATGGNPITGPSKDQFKVVGETVSVPELLVVAGPGAGEKEVEAMKDFLLNQVAKDPQICQQLGVTGFAPANRADYDAVRVMLSSAK